MGLSLQTLSYYDNSGGVDLKSSPTKNQEDEASATLNVDYSTDGAFYTRNGSTIMNVAAGIPAQMAGAPRTLALFDYKKSDGTQVNVICAGTTIKHNLVTPTDQVVGLSALLPIPDMEFQVTLDDEYLFHGNGIDTNRKFDGTTWTNWSIATPTDPTFNAFAAGNLTPGGYTYYVAYARTVLGVIVQISDLNPIPLLATVAAGPNQQITINIPVSADTQVNARVIYRSSPTSAGVFYQQGIVADNVTLTFTDNVLADGSIEAEFDNQPAPTSAIFEEYLGCMNIVDASRKTDLYESKPNKPWNVDSTNFEIFDGPIQCVKRVYGVIFIGTDKSIWIRSGTLASGAVSRRISSTIGVLNNRCAVGEGTLYIFATNKKFYAISPTDFSQTEIRIDQALSIKIEPLIAQINSAFPELVAMEYYTKSDTSKVLISVPIGTTTNNAIIIFNETQSQLKQKPVWQLDDNINASAMKQFIIAGDINIYSGDYNGFLWKLDDPSKNGDGAEVNGTATSGSTTTINDLTQNWTVNAFVGIRVRGIGGTGDGQVATITSNTATQLVFAAVTTAFDDTSEYTIGGYDAYHYSNWKHVTGSYDTLKQLWYFISNMNASGDYPVTLIIQYDFNTSISDQTEVNINLQAENAIWGQVIWGQFVWGSFSVFQDRIRVLGRFRAVRFGFLNRKAGQPYQCNGFSASVQDKGLFYKGAA